MLPEDIYSELERELWSIRMLPEDTWGIRMPEEDMWDIIECCMKRCEA